MAQRVWATLLTNASYLSGCLVLAESLRAVQSDYPLIVLVTASLPPDALHVLHQAGLETRKVEYLAPSGTASQWKNTADHRFQDTWTKLAVFGLEEFDRIVLLDSDMLVRQNMDELMTMAMAHDHIAASHACTCNPRRLKHYPADWNPETCAHTHAKGTEPPCLTPSSPRTFHLLNSGLVVLRPSQALFHDMAQRLHTDPVVQTFTFPDQDFLAMYFKNRWLPLGYQYNALKTMSHCHAALWDERAIKNVHYIIEKPWHGRSKAGDPYEQLHSYWWAVFDRLESEWQGDQKAWHFVLGTVQRS